MTRTENDSSNTQEDDGHIVKIRGMPWSTTAEEVLGFFNESNVLKGTEGVHLVMTKEGRPSGEAYIEFESEQDVEKALKKDRDYMGTRYIEVFRCKRSEMEWTLRKSGANADDYTDDGFVRLRGLPFECSSEDVAQFFSGLEIMPNGITLPMDQKGRSTGEAFVQFRSKAIAEKALNKHKEKIGHRYIEVFRSSMNEVYPDTRGRFGSLAQRPAPYDARNRFGGANRFGGSGNSRFRDDDDDGDGNWDNSYGRGGWGGNASRGFAGKSGYNGPPGPHIIHMRGLPYRATKQDVADFFQPVIPLSIDLIMNNQGRPSGEADVEFRTYEDSMEAMRKHKSLMSTRYIELFHNINSGGSGGRTKSSPGGGGGYRSKRY